MKEYVQIQSSVTINVTPGLHYQDHTNASAHIPDRLKISPVWPKLTVLIKNGQHWYPSEIAEWPAVKALVEKGLATIGVSADQPENDVDDAKAYKRMITKALPVGTITTTVEEVAKPAKKKKVEVEELDEDSDLEAISEGE